MLAVALATVGTALPPLTPTRWWTGWSVDGVSLAVALVAAAGYLYAVGHVHRRGGRWRRSSTAWFVVTGIGTWVAITCSFLGTYSRALLWPLAVQDVLLLTVVPVGLTLGRPLALWRAARPRSRATSTGPLRRLIAFPLTGSIMAVTMLLLVYTTGWDEARLEHPALLEATRVLLVVAGCGFLWPLLGVDEGTGRTSYPVRALIAFVDGLLDAVPGLAVLGTGHVIAAGWYVRSGRQSAAAALSGQRVGGTAMIALSELVGLPALVLLLVAWVRTDARQAAEVDTALDARVVAAPSQPRLERPWWEVDAGPLAGRAGLPPSTDDAQGPGRA